VEFTASGIPGTGLSVAVSHRAVQSVDIETVKGEETKQEER
jgi:hypothetical protein